MRSNTREGSFWTMIAFGLLVLLTASRWLFEGMVPGSGSTPASEALGAVLAGCAFLGSAAFGAKGRSASAGSGQGRWLRQVLAGCVVLTAPSLATLVAGRALGSNNGTFALTLTSVVVAVGGPVVSSQAEWDVVGRLWPGLAGSAGLLLLVPQPSFASWRPWLGLSALPLLTGVGAVIFQAVRPAVEDPDQRVSSAKASAKAREAALSCFLAALVLFTLHQFLLRARVQVEGLAGAAVLDGATLYLSLLVLSRAGAVGWSAQFLVVPLLVVVEGVVLLHPVLDARSWLGMGLLLVSGVRQMAAGREAGARPTRWLPDSPVPRG